MRTFAQKPKATQQNTSAKSPMPGRTHLGQSREVNSILYLQRTIGNQAVQKLLQAEPDGHEAVSDATASGRFGHDFSQIPVHAKASVKIQPKLAVNTPGDIYEQEADRVSDEVMHMPEPPLQRAAPFGHRLDDGGAAWDFSKIPPFPPERMSAEFQSPFEFHEKPAGTTQTRPFTARLRAIVRGSQSDAVSADRPTSPAESEPQIHQSDVPKREQSKLQRKDGESFSIPDGWLPSVSGEQTDSITSHLKYVSSIKNEGPPPTDFGITRYLFTGENVLVAHHPAVPGTPAGSGSAGTPPTSAFYDVSADIRGAITFQVNNFGRTDIASDSDPAITQKNYPNVVADLTPPPAPVVHNGLQVMKNQPFRDHFWARDLTIRHERFHSDEDDRFGAQGVQAAQAWLNTQTANSDQQLLNLLPNVTTIIGRTVTAGRAAPADEQRAYDNGAPLYLARAQAIKRKGDANGYAPRPATQPPAPALQPPGPAPTPTGTSGAAGQQLIAHGRTRVAQQQGSVLSRQPAAAPKQRWKELFPQFQAAQTSNPATATTLAEQLASAPRDDEDLRFQGLDVIAWLHSHGKTEEAVILLFDLRALLAFDVGQGQKLPNWVGADQTLNFSRLTGTGTLSGATPQQPIDPRVLIDAGKSAGAAGQHREALQFLGSANEILSLYALQVTRGGHSNAYAFREGRYAELSTIYNALRDIYQVYPQLEREARAAGKEKRADALHARGEELRHATLKQFAGVGEAQVAETDFVSRRTGAAYVLVGANKETTELTQLPGLSAPNELDSGVRVQDLSEIQTALMKQADVQEELRAEPEIAKAFPKGPIDLNDNTTRQNVWTIMFGVYKDRDGDGALASLMSLIGRYLKAYTVHTTYNVRDFGTSYLQSNFPTDLAGRAVRDCGVYALMVAWDVYLTAKAAGSAMDLTFSLAIMLDHVILLIEDNKNKATYIVSNDKITRAESADAAKETARAYASERNLEYLVSPEIDVPLGSLATPQKDFEKGVWDLYQKKVQHATDVAKAVDKKLPGMGLVSVFAAQEELNTLFKALDAAISNLRGSDDLAPRLDALLPKAFGALILFELIAKADKGPDPKHPVQVGLGKGLHPLVRVALAVLHVQEVGGTLKFQVPGTKAGKPAQLGAQDYVEHVDAFFQSQMAANRDAGKRGNF